MIGSLFARLSPWRKAIPGTQPPARCDGAVTEALERQKEALATRPEVDSLADSLRAHGVRNHFGESLERIYRGG